MEEVWKDIDEYEGLYQISSLGRVKSLKGNRKIHLIEKIILLSNTHNGYKSVSLSKNGKRKSFRVHRLVAKSFLENPLEKPYINHKDCNRTNNNINNLEWITQKENIKHSQKSDKGKFNNRNKPVAKCSNSGVILNVYGSISEASRQCGLSTSLISYCANNKYNLNREYLFKFINLNSKEVKE